MGSPRAEFGSQHSGIYSSQPGTQAETQAYMATQSSQGGYSQTEGMSQDSGSGYSDYYYSSQQSFSQNSER